MKRDRVSEDRLATSDVGVAFAAVHASNQVKKEKSDEEKMSLFWRLFGGTVLSIAALVAITVYNNLQSNLTELRGEISRINEARAELIKKDDLNRQMTGLYDTTKGLVGQNATQNSTLTALQSTTAELKDRLTTLKAESEASRKEMAGTIDAGKKDVGTTIEAIRKEQAAITDGLKKEIATLELVREQLKGIDAVRKDIEGIRKDLAAIDTLRDKVTMMVTEFKDIRDTVAKVRQDVERNEAADAERKKGRDDQYAKLLDTMKELDKAARACGEKVARLEGTIAPVTPMPMPPKKPAEKPAEKTEKTEKPPIED